MVSVCDHIIYILAYGVSVYLSCQCLWSSAHGAM